MKRILFVLLIYQFTFQLAAQVQVASAYVCPPCGSDCDKEKHENPGVCKHCNMVLVREEASKTIAFYLQDRVEVLDFAGPMEVFAYAGYKVFTVSKDKQPIKSQGILSVIPDYSIEDAPKADILAFFGGNSSIVVNDDDVIEWIKNQDSIQYHFSVCTGAFMLAEAGILDGHTATTFHSSLDGLESNYPKVDVRRDVRFVDNGKVITTAGISAGIDGALHLVAKLQGLNAAKRTAYYMEYDNWVPGDGLILSEDNPYLKEPKDLTDFVGRYEHYEKSDESLDLLIDNQELVAKEGKAAFPIYHEQEDIFSTVESAPIYFERNKKDQIVGYRLTPEGAVFKKLD